MHIYQVMKVGLCKKVNKYQLSFNTCALCSIPLDRKLCHVPIDSVREFLPLGFIQLNSGFCYMDNLCCYNIYLR